VTIKTHIRPMSLRDIPAVAELADSLPPAPHWPHDTYQFVLDSSNLPQRIALVADGPDRSLAAFAIASIVGSESELESIAVAPRFQRRGIARELIHRLTVQLREKAVTKIFLEVRASNQPARNLYSSLGFSVSGRRKSYYSDPPEDAVVLELSLVPADASLA